MRPLDESNVQSLASHRGNMGRVDPAIMYMALDGVLKGRYQDLAAALAAYNLQIPPIRVFKEISLEGDFTPPWRRVWTHVFY